MRFLVDNQLPRALAQWLASQPGCTATHVRDLSMNRAADEAIAELAEQKGLIVVTKDEDFVRLQRAKSFTIIWVRSGNIVNSELRLLIEREWEHVLKNLDSGARIIQLR